MKFILATGGTGGHLFPALRVVKVLKQQGHEVILAGALSMVEEKLKAQGCPYQHFNVRGLNLHQPVQCLQNLTLMLKAYFESLKMLNTLRPDAVLGFGGYGSVPIVLASITKNIPTMIHEQNVIPGRANRLLGRWVKRIAVSFQETQKYFNEKKVVHTGCPCHVPPSGEINKEEIFKSFGLDPYKKTILCFGGSQGSACINQAFFEAMKILAQSANVQAIHVTGKKDFEEYKRKYAELDLDKAIFPFLETIDQAYGVADVVVARAGAVSIHEMMAFETPAVIVPYPHAGGHQKFNALALCRYQLATMIEENDLTAKRLYNEIMDRLFMQKRNFNRIDKTDSFFCYDADVRLARELMVWPFWAQTAP